VVYPVLTDEERTTESQRYNCFTRNGGNAILKLADPEAKVRNPTTELTLLWVRNPFRGNFNHWQVSRKETGPMVIKHYSPTGRRNHGRHLKRLLDQQVAQLHDRYMMMIMMMMIKQEFLH